MLSGRKALESRSQIRLSSQLRAFTCFVLADCVVGLVGINFLLSSIISVTSENSSMLRMFDVSARLLCTSTRLARVPISSLASSPLHFFSIDVSPSGTYWATTLQLGLPLCNHLDLAASFLLGRCVVPVFPTGFPVFPAGSLGMPPSSHRKCRLAMVLRD